MAGWESLRVDLRRLLEESPDALVVFPDPDSEQRKQSIRIQLAAWATDIAATLNAKYGSLVDLRLGAMTFPAKQLWLKKRWYERWYELREAPAEPAGLDVEALSALSVRTGRDARRDVLVTNRAGDRQVLSTDGMLHSAVTDSSGNIVGLDVGPQPLPLVGFPIEPHHSSPVPVWIGTASVVPDPGLRRPAGTMGADHRASDRHRRHAVDATGDHHYAISSTRSTDQRFTGCSQPNPGGPLNRALRQHQETH